jgi:D-psicose/D-tagatose/L-ribulose 3-epimerase
MRLAISNIAWQPDEDRAVADLMAALGFTGLELAPTKPWPKPLEADPAQLADYRRFWEQRGIGIVAMQALLFGRSDLTLFDSGPKRRETLGYLSGIIRMGARLGVCRYVFGSPRNRRVGERPAAEAEVIAVEFFRQLGQVAAAHDGVVCIEPNPREYDCDFITNTLDALALVRHVDHPGFGLHIDAGALRLNSEDPEKTLGACAGALRHFHISEPFLAPVIAGKTPHSDLGATLRRLGYPHWASIEMRAVEGANRLGSIRSALATARQYYGDAPTP